MGSRIHREVYVRFRGEAMETYHGDMKRRCSLSLQPSAGEHPSQRKGQGVQDEAGGYQAAGRTKRFDFAENFGEVEK